MLIKAAKNINIVGSLKGVYIFGSEGATGKSFMGRILISLQEIGYPYAVVTVKGGSEVVYGDIEKAKFIFFDRFDLYVTDEWVSRIDNLGKSKLVLIDLKQFNKYNCKFGRAYIKLMEDEININLRG